MFTKSILTAAAIALVANLGTASADERFATIEGLPAIPISSGQAGKVFAAGEGTYANNRDHLGHAIAVSNDQARNFQHSYSSATGGVRFAQDKIRGNPGP